MRASQKSNRSRNKGNRQKSLGNVVNRVFESAGPEGKVRGTPQQIIDKYEQLARDAQTSGDRVTAENFHQHAEHYVRLLGAAQAEMQAEQERRQQAQQPPQGGGGQPKEAGQGGGGGQPPRREDDASGEGAGRGGLETIDPAEGDDALVATPESRGEDQPAPGGAEGGDEEGGAQAAGGEGAAKPSRSARRRRARRSDRQEGEGDGAAASTDPAPTTQAASG